MTGKVYLPTKRRAGLLPPITLVVKIGMLNPRKPVTIYKLVQVKDRTVQVTFIVKRKLETS